MPKPKANESEKDYISRLESTEIGKKYARLTIQSLFGRSSGGKTLWKCTCECGKEKIVAMGDLRSGGTKSCGCLSREHAMRRLIDLAGKRFGKLVVLSIDESKTEKRSDGSRKFYWVCRCDCGNLTSVLGSSLSHEQTKSCGCWRIESRKLPTGEAAFNNIYDHYIREAKRRNFEWGLSEENFRGLTSSNCYYCGEPPFGVHKARNGNYIYNGIDRVDNKIGYIDGNVVPCCKICNLAKRGMSKKDFISWIKKAARHLEVCDAQT